ncbi:MAG: tetratricopeptide repeat protein [Parvibaculum sp.]|uniref:tetratricopeptide repeat protein n=1 Tax=Parvibaculum sp. TaxID=2024848 RepID=UPI00271C261C|nr:tetratricopeptide repeat protein [Parvibaculum sp.]MDO8838048.1 tetratricopeptide repeat protein [Parvibaculum sp.]
MRLCPLAALLAAALLAATGARAETEMRNYDLPDADGESADAPDSREAALDLLFERLASAKSEVESRAFEEAIRDIWLDSGSPGIDLLMARGFDALREEDYDRAYFYFDEVVTLAPAFAEGWDKRAAVHYIREDYAEALRDIEQVLRLEPRHYQAMAGLGVILEELGDKKGALEAFRRALALNPWLTNITERIGPLEIEVEGRGI